MLPNHKDDIEIRNPWWCGGPVPKSMSREDEFWSYPWLNVLVLTMIDLTRSLFSSINRKKSITHKMDRTRNLCAIELTEESIID